MAKAVLADLAPRDRPYKVRVDRSLFLFVNPNGSKWWRFRYRFAGHEKLLSLGVFPKVPLKSALKARDRCKEQVQRGTDPSVVRQGDRITRIHRLVDQGAHDVQFEIAPSGGLIIRAGSRAVRLSKRHTAALRVLLVTDRK